MNYNKTQKLNTHIFNNNSRKKKQHKINYSRKPNQNTKKKKKENKHKIQKLRVIRTSTRKKHRIKSMIKSTIQLRGRSKYLQDLKPVLRERTKRRIPFSQNADPSLLSWRWEREREREKRRAGVAALNTLVFKGPIPLSLFILFFGGAGAHSLSFFLSLEIYRDNRDLEIQREGRPELKNKDWALSYLKNNNNK